MRDTRKVSDLLERYPETFRAELLDVNDTRAVREVVDRTFAQLGRVDVIVSNAGYGLFGAAEELSDAQVGHLIATNLTGSIQLIRSALPHLRAQGGGRIVQMSTYGGQVAFPGNSMCHATKWDIEGFAEAVAQEAAPFGIGVTIVEPGGARTEFRYGSAPVADLIPAYDNNPAHSFLTMLDPANGLAPGDPARMAARIIESVDIDPRHCAWCSARRRCKPPWRRCASGSPTSRSKQSSPHRPTSRPAMIPRARARQARDRSSAAPGRAACVGRRRRVSDCSSSRPTRRCWPPSR